LAGQFVYTCEAAAEVDEGGARPLLLALERRRQQQLDDDVEGGVRGALVQQHVAPEAPQLPAPSRVKHQRVVHPSVHLRAHTARQSDGYLTAHK